MYEIEAKVRVDDLDQVRRRLLEQHAERICEDSQHDVYYNAPHRDFAVTDEALRVRYTSGAPEITYKGPKIATPGIKARREINVKVDSGEKFEELLELVGFTRTASVVKHREEYRWRGATIALDSIEELGTFVEIEVVTTEMGEAAEAHIHELEEKLGVPGTHIADSYLELILRKQ